MLETFADSEIYRVSRINKSIEVGFSSLGLWTYRFSISGRFGNKDRGYALIWDTLQSVICREDGSKPDRKTINNFLNYAGEYKELVKEDTKEIRDEVNEFLRALSRLFNTNNPIQ